APDTSEGNRTEFLAAFPKEEVSTNGQREIRKNLGVYWKKDENILTFKPPPNLNTQSRSTMRQMLSHAARRLWIIVLGWDTPLPPKIERQWRSLASCPTQLNGQMHAGVSQTLVAIRTGFWIVRDRNAIKKVIRSCPVCRRVDAQPYRLRMGVLPADQVTETPPFIHTGVDFADILILFRDSNWAKLQRKFNEERIRWKFITPRAPWCGGYWERLIRSIKNALRKTIRGALLKCDELHTVLCEIETRINDRPLVLMGDDIGDKEMAVSATSDCRAMEKIEATVRHHPYHAWKMAQNSTRAQRVVLQPQTVICDFETALIPAVQASFPGVQIQGCYFHFCQAVLREVAELGLRTRYLHEGETKKKIKMLMATAFLPLPEVPAAVELLGRNVTEGWHLKMNRQAGKHHLSFYEPLQLLIDEQGSTETLIQQVTSGRVTANDLQIKNNKYEEVQLRITALTAEYDGGTRTMEQFLKAVAYDVPEPINF
ncbi:hypothetical protein T05_810, partial [Trichinella murrelli]